MTGALFALGSAVFYGLADFTGGLLSRRAGFAPVAFAGQAGGLVLTLVAAPLTAAPSPDAADLGWGALSGVGTGLGMVFLYRGMGRGEMSVVVPVSAVGGLALPVLAGVVLLGERPSALAWLGVAMAGPALWLVSRNGAAQRPSAALTGASLDGLPAGAGIALQYAALAQATEASGLWPVTVGRVAAMAVILPALLLAVRRAGRRAPEQSVPLPSAAPAPSTPPRPDPSAPTRPAPPPAPAPAASLTPADGRRRGGLGQRPSAVLSARQAAGAAGTGVLAALALVLYLLATREQILTVAVVLSSLYPAIPVLLALTVLRESPTRLQTAGLIGAAAAVGLLTAG